MATLSRKHTSKLESCKSNVQDWHDYFNENFKRYDEFMTFTFDTSLSSTEISKLATLKKPTIEFNIMEAYISRLRGEFVKHEPGVSVRASDSVPLDHIDENLTKTIDVLEGHQREIFYNCNNDSLSWKVHFDMLGGGFSAMEVYTDYVNEVSFQQCIKIGRVFSPCLIGFDPLAQLSHKGDGNYCFKLYPMTRDDFEDEFGAGKAKDVKFARQGVSTDSANGSAGFNWAYQNQGQDIVLVCEYFEKVKKRTKIVKLSDGHTLTKRDYDRFLEVWRLKGFIEQPPAIIDERYTNLETIHRYRFCGHEMLDHIETDFKHLPIVFFDGNSVMLRHNGSGATKQMTRPYVYHAKGNQKLRNFCGQTMAADIENITQAKFKVALEAIPEKYLDAYQNPQDANILIYNAFYKDDPQYRLDPPMEIMKVPLPPIVEQTFMNSDAVMQSILGSYDGLLGINDQQISGVAIQQGALQSNAAAMPYLMGYIKGLNRIAEIVLDLIPKYYDTPRSIPIRTADGKRSSVRINVEGDPESVMMNYDPNDLEVKIEVGVNANVQKQVALDQITRMMASSEAFAGFINSKGLEIIIDNLDIRRQDKMKELAAEYMQEQQQAAEAAQGQQDPMIEVAQAQVQAEHEVGMAEVDAKREKTDADMALGLAKVAVEKQKIELQYQQVMAQIRRENLQYQRESRRDESLEASEAIKLAMDIAKTNHQMREDNNG